MKNYKSAVSAIGQISTLVDKFGTTPGIQAKVALAISGLYPVITSVAKVDFKAVKEEIKNATPEQKAEINAEFDKTFDLANDKLEQLVENAVDFGSEVKQTIAKGKQLLSDFKALKKA